MTHVIIAGKGRDVVAMHAEIMTMKVRGIQVVVVNEPLHIIANEPMQSAFLNPMPIHAPMIPEIYFEVEQKKRHKPKCHQRPYKYHK